MINDNYVDMYFNFLLFANLNECKSTKNTITIIHSYNGPFIFGQPFIVEYQLRQLKSIDGAIESCIILTFNQFDREQLMRGR